MKTKTQFESSLRDAAEEAVRRIPPVWPLASSVAVNPFLGHTGETLAGTAASLARVGGIPVTMPRDWYLDRIAAGEITDHDLAAALAAAPHAGKPADIEALKRGEEPRIEAFGREGRPLGQHADRVVAVQAFLVARHHAEIADARIVVQRAGKEAGGILDEDRVGGVEFREGLFVLALDHHLRFGRDGTAAEFDQIFEPERSGRVDDVVLVLVAVLVAEDEGAVF